MPTQAETFLIIFGFLLCVLGMVGTVGPLRGSRRQVGGLALIAGAVSGLVAAAGVVIMR